MTPAGASGSVLTEPRRLELTGGRWIDVEQCADVPDDFAFVGGVTTWLRFVGHSDPAPDPAEAIAALEAAKLEWAAEVKRRVLAGIGRERPKLVLPVTAGGDA